MATLDYAIIAYVRTIRSRRLHTD